MLFGGFDPISIISLAITLVVAITVHEFAHAVVADRLGDPTPRHQGRLTLNPLKHLDPLGSLMFLFAGFGWGRPVATRPQYFRTGVRSGMALVAAAGPLSNLLLALLAAIPVRLNLFSALPANALTSFSASFVVLFVTLNLLLLLFNLIPLAPLDGSKVAIGVLPDELAAFFIRLERSGPMILMLLILSGYVTSRFGFTILGLLINPPLSTLRALLLGI